MTCYFAPSSCVNGSWRSSSSKYRTCTDKQNTYDLPQDRYTILVPGQVESDASIATGSPHITTNSGLSAVRSAHPDAFIIYKAHPDVLSGARIGKLDTNAKRR